jgi:hypothetical protein
MSTENTTRDSVFFKNLPADFVLGEDAAQQRLLREYGAVFVARGGVIAPNKVVFKDEEDVTEFQSKLRITQRQIGGFSMELQAAAMDQLLSAIGDADNAGLSITPRGADSARRNYNDTVELWASRVEPALIHWVGKGRMTKLQAEAIRVLPPYEQLPEVFALEADGIFLAKDLSKSIIYSVAPPGASQHLSLLAFDIAEFDDRRVREILANHYWYQTVISDLPHFTFLGLGEDELPGLGLKKVTHSEREFWVPDV